MKIIATYDNNFVTDVNGVIPWDMPSSELYYETTTEHSNLVISENRFINYFNSVPLPNRRTFVTKDTAYINQGSHEECLLDEAIQICSSMSYETFFCGCAENLNEVLRLGLIKEIYAIEIDVTVPDDPDNNIFVFDTGEFVEQWRESHSADETNPYNYDFVLYRKNNHKTTVNVNDYNR